MDHPFAEQCQELARSFLINNLGAINEDGTLTPHPGETAVADEPGHAAFAIGEYFRATNETTLQGHDLVDLAARTITAQAFAPGSSENGIAYAALGLLSFGPSKERNPVWERLVDETKELLDSQLLSRNDYEDHLQAFNIAKSVTRYSFGLSKKDETGRLIEKFIERLNSHSSGGYLDDSNVGIGGTFDIYGILSFVFIRQALQLHSNIGLRERKLPTLRTHSEKYLKLMPDLVRSDGLGWAYGENIGAYGQMHCISLILQALRDDWVTSDKKPYFLDTLRSLFHFFFVTYVEQEQGYLVIRDGERTTIERHTSRMANFDAARYCSQWSRLARSIGGNLGDAVHAPSKQVGRFVCFDKSANREHGLFIYTDPQTGLHLQLPLVTNKGRKNCDSLTFPHAPGIFDWPVGQFLPIMVPELKIGDKSIVPCFYGKGCTTGLGPRKSLFFRYEQPELITADEEILKGLGSCKVNWTFLGSKITSEFTFMVKAPLTIDSMRYVLAISLPHSSYRLGTSFTLGPEGLRASVLKDDFLAEWQENEIVNTDSRYRTYYGSLYYLQTLARNHPLVLRPGMRYTLHLAFEPDIALVDE
ncbi:MAG: hypothetical protein ACFCU4_03545 [Puniceicoccaceae bacterium]